MSEQVWGLLYVHSQVEDFDLKFRAAWMVFSETCGESVAPKATYQAWFAHYLISQFGIDRVAREPNFKHKRFESPFAGLVTGAQVRLDAVVTRQPGVNLPHYTHRNDDGDGMSALVDLAVVSELKVSSTQGEGLALCADGGRPP